MLAFKSSLSNYCCSGELIVPCSPGTPLQFYSCWFLPAWRREKKKKAALSSGFFSVFLAQKIWRQTQILMQRNSRYVSPLLMSSSKIIVWYSKTRTWKYSVSCVVPSSSFEMKMKASATDQWCLTDWYEVPNIIRKELALTIHSWCWITR